MMFLVFGLSIVFLIILIFVLLIFIRKRINNSKSSNLNKTSGKFREEENKNKEINKEKEQNKTIDASIMNETNHENKETLRNTDFVPSHEDTPGLNVTLNETEKLHEDFINLSKKNEEVTREAREEIEAWKLLREDSGQQSKQVDQLIGKNANENFSNSSSSGEAKNFHDEHKSIIKSANSSMQRAEEKEKQIKEQSRQVALLLSGKTSK